MYVIYDGIVFNRRNRLDFYARAEAFLAHYLAGRAEPMPPNGYPGVTPAVTVIGN